METRKYTSFRYNIHKYSNLQKEGPEGKVEILKEL